MSPRVCQRCLSHAYVKKCENVCVCASHIDHLILFLSLYAPHLSPFYYFTLFPPFPIFPSLLHLFFPLLFSQVNLKEELRLAEQRAEQFAADSDKQKRLAALGTKVHPLISQSICCRLSVCVYVCSLSYPTVHV